MRKMAGGVAAAALAVMTACDDGRQERIPGVTPGMEAQPADTVWADTLHPPVPPAPDPVAPPPGTPEPAPPEPRPPGEVPPR